jgi:hypothetical protein
MSMHRGGREPHPAAGHAGEETVMTTLAPERPDELVTSLRRGMDLDDLANPAGGLFADGYTEHEITMTGSMYTYEHDPFHTQYRICCDY